VGFSRASHAGQQFFTCHRANALSGPVLAALSVSGVRRAVTSPTWRGCFIEANIHRTQDIKREGRSLSNQVHQQWKIFVNADKTIEER